MEPSLKAALRGVGVETLKMHDVGSLLRTHRRKFPDRFRQQISKLAAISRRLRLERELSFCGEEETQTAPQDLYGREDAVLYLKEAAFVHAQCRTLLAGRVRSPRREKQS